MLLTNSLIARLSELKTELKNGQRSVIKSSLVKHATQNFHTLSFSNH